MVTNWAIMCGEPRAKEMEQGFRNGGAGTFRFRTWVELRAYFAELEMVDAVVGEVGRRVHLRWRLRARPHDTADRWLVVEQQVYAEAEPGEAIHRLALLCSGFSWEAPRG